VEGALSLPSGSVTVVAGSDGKTASGADRVTLQFVTPAVAQRALALSQPQLEAAGVTSASPANAGRAAAPAPTTTGAGTIVGIVVAYVVVVALAVGGVLFMRQRAARPSAAVLEDNDLTVMTAMHGAPTERSASARPYEII
jgi:hypothetical protein